MKPEYSRRMFIRATTAAALGAPLLAAPVPLIAQTQPAPNRPPPRPPALPPEQVQATVSESHRNLEKVKQLVEATPLLANSVWDWGGGDFETALEAAAHTGRREIAEYLLSKGARPSLYAAGMLGQLDLVKAFLRADPKAADIPGPHGFTLLHCAKQGGEVARPVYDWLVELGVPEVFNRPLSYVWPEDAAPAKS